MWNILVHNKVGYSRHPETMRWVGKQRALYDRHEALVAEMQQRGYQHNSPLDPALATGSNAQDIFIDPLERQLQLLRDKPCDCLRESLK